MLYIHRNAGKVEAIRIDPRGQGVEQVDWEDSAIQTYLHEHEITKMDLLKLALKSTDLDFIRALEDTIMILLEKGVVSYSDYPPAVAAKLKQREALRKQLRDEEKKATGTDNR